MELRTLSSENRRELYENLKDEYLIRYPGREVPDMESFFGDLEPVETPPLLRRLYHTFF